MTSVTEYSKLIGRKVIRCHIRGEELALFDAEGNEHLFHHIQDCCESVYIESIVGDISDLIGSAITEAESVSEDYPEAYDSGTWTFLKISSEKGGVVIRFLGESNGYYSEKMDYSYNGRRLG
jgi:hypothetical protein